MNKYKLRASDDKGRLLEDVVVEMSDSETLMLNEYLENHEELLKCKIFESNFPMIKGFTFKDGAMSVEVTDFEYRDLYEPLHLARPLFLAREPASFEKVCAIFGKKFQGTTFSKHLKQVRELYKHGEHRQFMQMSINGTKLFDEKIISAWLNGVEYHHDPEKKEFVKNLESVLGEKIARGVFVSILKGRIKALGYIADLARLCSKESKI